MIAVFLLKRLLDRIIKLYLHKFLSMEFLEFEVPIKEILDQIDKCKSIEDESDVDITKTYNLLQKAC